MEVRLFTLFFKLAQAENRTKTKDFHLSCNLIFLIRGIKYGALNRHKSLVNAKKCDFFSSSRSQ